MEPESSLPQSQVPATCAATVYFPCGFGRVSFRSAQQLEGLGHRITSMGGPWKAHVRLRLANALIHTQFRFLSLILFAEFHCRLQIWSMIFPFNIVR
jgi:hypothetical protein